MQYNRKTKREIMVILITNYRKVSQSITKYHEISQICRKIIATLVCGGAIKCALCTA